jgi:hypothetical protein
MERRKLKFLRDRRAQARIFEAIITIAIVFPFAMYLQSYRAPGETQNPELTKIGAEVLANLDREGTLISLFATDPPDWMRLREAVKASLPADVSFIVTVQEMVWVGSPAKLTFGQTTVTIGHGALELTKQATINYALNVLTGTNRLRGYLITLTLMKG